ncbi:MAG TPA: YbjN domain-containing protein [Blastocatellia bacterium]|nr:YbjN domain-containing protein [Blastocatellia bacterium]
MEFKSAAHKQAYDQARDYLHALFGEVNVTQMGDTLALPEGSTYVYVRAFPIGDKQAGVEVFSYVVIDIEVTEALMRHLLTYNLRLIFGSFGLSLDESGKGAIVLSHTILGDGMQSAHLYASVAAIARAADDLDDQLIAVFGGKTAFDKVTSITHEPVEFWE